MLFQKTYSRQLEYMLSHFGPNKLSVLTFSVPQLAFLINTPLFPEQNVGDFKYSDESLGLSLYLLMLCCLESI
jgi:hypothetical protein